MTRVRFAPSPTGELHIGGARTALYNYLFAKQQQGQFVLRLEDTDQTRYVAGAEKRLLDDLKWLGITWDEGPDRGGQYGPYIQSQRLDSYKKFANQLVENKQAYYCFCTADRLAQLRAGQEASKLITKYDRRCLNLSSKEVEDNLKQEQSFVIRLKVPNGQTSFVDLVHGRVNVDNLTVDDQVLLKSDGFPTYHLANVVDDHLMAITHVIRGEEWLPSTAKHIILYHACNWDPPQWLHLPNVLNKNRAKLSKRKDGDGVWLSTYQKNGYLQGAMVNFLALLGWHPQDNQEIFSIDDLVKKFNINRVQKAGAIFDIQKLDWFNAQYIKMLSPIELDSRLKPFYMSDSEDTVKLSTILQTRINKLADAALQGNFYFTHKLNYPPLLLVPANGSLEKTISALEMGESILINQTDWTIDALKNSLMKLTVGQFTKQELLWPIRIAITGEERSPDVFEVLWALGQSRSLKRINQAKELLR